MTFTAFNKLRRVLQDYDESKNNSNIPDEIPSYAQRQLHMDIFDKALDFVLEMEGVYTNDRQDPGGTTKYGISSRAYPHLDIENITLDDARALYIRDYWKGSGAKVADISPELAMIMFDTAVNMGTEYSIRLLQRILHIKEDGIFGPITKSTLEVADIDQLIDWYMTNRMLRYTELEAWSRYRRGWTRRLMSLLRRVYTDK